MQLQCNVFPVFFHIAHKTLQVVGTNTLSICSAAHFGDLEVIRELAVKKTDLNTAKDGTAGATPLFLAAHQGHADAIDLLVSLRAEVNLGNVHSGRATPIFVASLKGHANAVKSLARLQGDVNMAMEGGAGPDHSVP